MAEEVIKIRVFISSPSDVSEEREVALKVIEGLNQSICDGLGLMLFPLTWENSTYPSVGKYSQDVINNQIGEYDIFVGIMANRFGSPTPKAESGTEEEFNIAFKNRKKNHIMFFFKDAEVKPSSLDIDQFSKVRDFKKKIGKQGVYYKEFSKDFEGLFRDSLTQYITKNYLTNNEEHNIKEKESLKTNQLNSFFEIYYNRMKEELSSINVLAVPNSQFKLKDIYVTQSLVKNNHFESEREIIKINRFPEKQIEKYKKILITDTAGMGKSTIMKYMFLDLIDNNRIKDVGIPIFIELNRLNKEHTIFIEINEELDLTKELEKDLLLKYFQKGGFIFFLDGFDEISIADRNEVTKDIQTFISKNGNNNYYILASRTEDSLANFGDFQSFSIQPLTKKEAFELLTKYDTSKQKKTSKELIKELNTDKYNSIDEYLENPLLASLLYTSFNYRAEIPLKKHQFYRQVYDALFSNHKVVQSQKPHEKRSNLDVDDFDRVLRYLGYECLINIGVQFDKDTILNSIQKAKDFCGNLLFKESDFLKDLLTSVPLFTKDGTGYKWAHKSLMEYFAARFIYCDAKKKQNSILSAIYNSEHVSKYLNMLDLYYDIDNYGFIKNIELPFLKDFIAFYERNYFESSQIEKKYIEERIGVLYANKVCISSSEKNIITDDFFIYFSDLFKKNIIFPLIT